MIKFSFQIFGLLQNSSKESKYACPKRDGKKRHTPRPLMCLCDILVCNTWETCSVTNRVGMVWKQTGQGICTTIYKLVGYYGKYPSNQLFSHPKVKHVCGDYTTGQHNLANIPDCDILGQWQSQCTLDSTMVSLSGMYIGWTKKQGIQTDVHIREHILPPPPPQHTHTHVYIYLFIYIHTGRGSNVAKCTGQLGTLTVTSSLSSIPSHNHHPPLLKKTNAVTGHSS